MSDASTTYNRMQSLLQRWQSSGDQRSVFLSCYSMMTSNMLDAIQAGEFEDPQWVSDLLEHFAGYYFHALDAYEAGDHEPPAVWQFTFNAANQPHTNLIENLLLGVNAHINYDLSFAVADRLKPDWESLSQPEQQSRYLDFTHVNEVIARTIDRVQDEIIEKKESWMDLFDRLLGPLDEWLVSRLITHWRERVWTDAMRLVATSEPVDWESLRQEIESHSLKVANLVQVRD